MQGVALAALVAVLAIERALRRARCGRGRGAGAAGRDAARCCAGPGGGRGRPRETRPLVNVGVLAAGRRRLTLLACGVPTAGRAGPLAGDTGRPDRVAVVLIGFFVLVTRRRALSQLVGFLLMDNGITAVGFLTTAGIGLVVEVGVALDVLLVVLVLQVLTGRMREASAAPIWTSYGSCTTDDHPALLAPVLVPLAGAARLRRAGWRRHRVGRHRSAALVLARGGRHSRSPWPPGGPLTAAGACCASTRSAPSCCS